MTNSFSSYEKVAGCPLCGSAQFTLAHAPDVARCENCHTLFRSPRPTQDEIKRSYDCGQNYDHWKEEFDARQSMWLRRIALIKQQVEGGRMLDVGVGDGHFLDVAQQVGFATSGTELSKTGADLARGRGHEIFLGQFSEFTSPDPFDVVTIWHVLEHVPDPGAVLAHAFAVLRPGGILVVAVPNEANPLIKHRLKGEKAVNPLGEMVWGGEIHLTHFQPFTLKRAVRSAGFEVIRFGVDDIYFPRSTRSRLSLGLQSTVNLMTGWHCAVAMYAIGRK